MAFASEALHGLRQRGLRGLRCGKGIGEFGDLASEPIPFVNDVCRFFAGDLGARGGVDVARWAGTGFSRRLMRHQAGGFLPSFAELLI